MKVGYHGKVSTHPQTAIVDLAIRSDQLDVHPDLSAVVERHKLHAWRKPIPAHTQQAVEQLRVWLDEHSGKPVILDSFCGTGMSTANLAQQFPEAAVIGIDKSAARLGKHQRTQQENYCLIRAECEPLWRLLVEHRVPIWQHYLLYPNPWPKSSHLKRRVHGHPAFALLSRLGGSIELRSNWSIYVREFAQAWRQLGLSGQIIPLTVTTPLTLFERKYAQRGQQLWQFRSEALP